MTNERFDALFGGPPRQPGGAADAAPHGPRRLDPGGDRGGRAAPDARARGARPGSQQPLPRRRRGAQLRGQRQDPARRALRATSGSSRRRAMPAARSARRWRPGTIHLGQPRAATGGGDAMRGAYLGPRFAQTRDRAAPRRGAARASSAVRRRADRRRAAATWPTGKAVGWFQGRMEFGPRALGGRSILGDPRSPTHAEDAQPQGQVPRESFRPFAPSVLREDVARLVRARRRQPLHAAGRRRRRSAGAAP